MGKFLKAVSTLWKRPLGSGELETLASDLAMAPTELRVLMEARSGTRVRLLAMAKNLVLLRGTSTASGGGHWKLRTCVTLANPHPSARDFLQEKVLNSIPTTIARIRTIIKNWPARNQVNRSLSNP